MNDRDEFYIGYETGPPPGIRRRVGLAVVVAIAGAVVVAATFVTQQRRLADARFEYGVQRSFSGYLTLSPAPALLSVDSHGTHVHWLVAPGKAGAAAVLGAAQPGWVTVSGSLIEREQWRMIEVAAGSLRRHDIQPPPPSSNTTAPRTVVLTGEIVDGKCFLGVMNPGERTVHRDCAVRCLAGGVPAMFAFRDESGSHLALLLGAGDDDRRSGVGGQVSLAGALTGTEDALVLSLAPRR